MASERQGGEPSSIYPRFDTFVEPFKDILRMPEISAAPNMTDLIGQGLVVMGYDEFTDRFRCSGLIVDAKRWRESGGAKISDSKRVSLDNGNVLDISMTQEGHIDPAGTISYQSNIEMSSDALRPDGAPHLQHRLLTGVTGILMPYGARVQMLQLAATDYPVTTDPDAEPNKSPGKLLVAVRNENNSYQVVAARGTIIDNYWDKGFREAIGEDDWRTLIRNQTT